MLDMARRRHEAFQRRNYSPEQRTKFKPEKITLPELDKGKFYLIGVVFMPKHIVKNFEHYIPVMSKDFKADAVVLPVQ